MDDDFLYGKISEIEDTMEELRRDLEDLKTEVKKMKGYDDTVKTDD